jgi:hypothetical protein
MKINHNKIFIAVFSVILIVSVSCNKEEDISSPEIMRGELGYDNSGTVTLGDELHMEFEIDADGKVEMISVEIHHEGEHKSLSTVMDEMEWEFDSVYTDSKYVGARNIEFHEHIDIPMEAEAGEYHFHLMVRDMEGNTSSYEDELELLEPVVK